MSIVSTSHAAVLSKLGPRPACWREAMRRAVRSWDVLAELLELPVVESPQVDQAWAQFPLFVPREMVARMRPGDPADPLLLQVVPRAEETITLAGYGTDPVGDEAARLAPGLLRKYANRALLVVTGACAVHCRYCFRRHFPYQEVPGDTAAWQPALRQLRELPEVDEIILSGGDPLTLVDQRLAGLVAELDALPHLRRLRIHTRLPIAIPQRITPTLIDLLRQSRLTPWFVVHINHPQEIDEHVAAACQRLVDAGIPVLNQAVILRGINDCAATLVELCRKLADLRILPYYLHLLDPVAGAAHFDVPQQRAEDLVAELRRQLSGYAVPRLVREVAGVPHKTVLA